MEPEQANKPLILCKGKLIMYYNDFVYIYRILCDEVAVLSDEEGRVGVSLLSHALHIDYKH